MDNNWAAENLQTIRTLMERSAVYRRALAPITIFVGMAGIIAALAGWTLKLNDPRLFVIYWLGVSLAVIVGAFFLVRRQALKQKEVFWSPPTRRVALAMFPALAVGLAVGNCWASVATPKETILVWCMMYGLALHAAGFFMPRGVKYFACWFWLGGIILYYRSQIVFNPSVSPHMLMGALFGASHLAYGIYLQFTEPRKNEA